MTTKPTIKRFQVRRRAKTEDASPPSQSADTAEDEAEVEPELSHAEQIEAIRNEGLTARQLRMARRVALNNGFEASSDYDAVRQLRAAGIDPFQRSSVVDLVTPDRANQAGKKVRIQLPDTTKQGEVGFPNQAAQ